MSGRTYAQSKCPVCKEYVSNAGAARASHNRKHAKEGTLVALYSRVLDRTDYFTPERAQAYLDGTVKNYANWLEVAS